MSLVAISAVLTPCCNLPVLAWPLRSSDAARVSTLSIVKSEVRFGPFVCPGSLRCSTTADSLFLGRDVAQPTSSSPMTQPSSNPDTPSAGYSTSDKIALGIGLGLGLPTLLITAWEIFRFKSRGRRR